MPARLRRIPPSVGGVGGERRREPDESRDKVRQRRERGGDEQEWRRVMPAVVVRKVVADGADFGRLVQGPVVGGSGDCRRARGVPRPTH